MAINLQADTGTDYDYDHVDHVIDLNNRNEQGRPSCYWPVCGEIASHYLIPTHRGYADYWLCATHVAVVS